jgi:hypothetical protein
MVVSGVRRSCDTPASSASLNRSASLRAWTQFCIGNGSVVIVTRRMQQKRPGENARRALHVSVVHGSA